MKLKTTILVASSLLAGVMGSSAATMFINNIVFGGPGDTLYANNNGTLMTGGLATIGYFASGVTQADVDTVPELYARLLSGSFTVVTSAAPGSVNSVYVEAIPGYVDQTVPTSIGTVTVGNTLLGRTIYSIVTDASVFTVGLGAGEINSSSNFAMVSIGLIKDDDPFAYSYSSDPNGLTPIIGTIGTFTGVPGGSAPEGAYTTLQMAIPETSSVLLGALGALGLLRRRR